MPKIDKAGPYKHALTNRLSSFSVSVEEGKEEEWEEVHAILPDYIHDFKDLLFHLSRNNYHYTGIDMVFSQTESRKFTVFDGENHVLFSGEVQLGLELIKLFAPLGN